MWWPFMVILLFYFSATSWRESQFVYEQRKEHTITKLLSADFRFILFQFLTDFSQI